MPVPVPLVHDALPINGIRMHCLEYRSDGPPMLLLHSLTGNSRMFDGLVAAGLASSFRLLVPDMRGRGQTEAPLAGYTLEDGAHDILALLDHFGIEQVAVCGHSFGALQALYFAAHYPERVTHLLMLDAAAEMHPAAPVMAAMAAARLDAVFLSAETYVQMVKVAPFVDRWYEEMRGFVLADAQPLGFGMVTTRARGYTAALASLHIYAHSSRDWKDMASRVEQPALLLQATSPFLMGMPMLTDGDALETVGLMPLAWHSRISGNHFSMLFGPGAEEIVAAIESLFSVTEMDVEPAAAAA
jgi:pimeloyl-ACP methyl ester carboxylesterase